MRNLPDNEVRKHIDKHERPYTCKESECAEVKGFTTLGGLHRHEREVHHKYSWDKKLFFCPHTNCKRSKKPFTRREKLEGHMRTVHGHEEPPAILLPQNALPDHTTYIESKRKRQDTEVDRETEEYPDHTLRAELKRLRVENKLLVLENERLIDEKSTLRSFCRSIDWSVNRL